VSERGSKKGFKRKSKKEYTKGFEEGFKLDSNSQIAASIAVEKRRIGS
jgi:hypothetical protein